MIFQKQIGGQINNSTNSPIQLTDRQKDVLDLIRQNNKVSRKELSKLLDIVESAMQKYLEVLKEKRCH
jgi:ATP-dependent DNA helicase RecG